MEIIRPSTLPGFLELLPEDQVRFNKIKNLIEDTFIKYGFLPVDTPAIERSEILLAKGGGETTKQIYFIEREDKDMALRFDLTVPLARYVAEHYNELNFPFRRYHIAKVYRGERNQRGRFREFYQCDIDIIGDEFLSSHNDAEIPATMYEIFTKLNLSSIRFHVSNRKILVGLLEDLAVEDTEAIIRTIDKVKKVQADRFKELLMEDIEDDSVADRIINFINYKGSNQEILSYISTFDSKNALYKEGVEDLNDLYRDMIALGINDNSIAIDLSITRGLDYYTGSVFETFIQDHEDIGSIASGGRYDDLASNYTSKKLPGVGMSIGLSRLFFQLKDANMLEDTFTPPIKTMVLPMVEDYSLAYEILDSLRNNGIVSMAYVEEGKFKKKLRYADRLKIPFVLILGENEIQTKKVSLKNMVTGKQELLELDEAIDIIKKS